MEKQQEKASNSFGAACEALMTLAAKLITLVDGLISSCIEVAKSYPDVPITFTDLRLSAYRHMGYSTYTGTEKNFFNVYTGKSETCMLKGKGKTKTGKAVAVQEALARIAKACETDKVSELVGWIDSDKKETAPSLAELKYRKKALTKEDDQVVSSTKEVGQTVNAPKATSWDMEKLDTQLKRINTVLADCESQNVVDQFATDVAALANVICSLLQIKNDELRAKAMKARHLVNQESVNNKKAEKELAAVAS